MINELNRSIMTKWKILFKSMFLENSSVRPTTYLLFPVFALNPILWIFLAFVTQLTFCFYSFRNFIHEFLATFCFQFYIPPVFYEQADCTHKSYVLVFPLSPDLYFAYYNRCTLPIILILNIFFITYNNLQKHLCISLNVLIFLLYQYSLIFLLYQYLFPCSDFENHQIQTTSSNSMTFKCP